MAKETAADSGGTDSRPADIPHSPASRRSQASPRRGTRSPGIPNPGIPRRDTRNPGIPRRDTRSPGIPSRDTRSPGIPSLGIRPSRAIRRNKVTRSSPTRAPRRSSLPACT